MRGNDRRSFLKLTVAAYVVSGALGTLLMGVGFDRTGAYIVPLTGFFFATSIAAVLFSLLGPYKYGVRQFRAAVSSDQALAAES